MIGIELGFLFVGVIFGICVGIGMYRRIFEHDAQEIRDDFKGMQEND